MPVTAEYATSAACDAEVAKMACSAVVAYDAVPANWLVATMPVTLVYNTSAACDADTASATYEAVLAIVT